jgi:hypothetical protein
MFFTKEAYKRENTLFEKWIVIMIFASILILFIELSYDPVGWQRTMLLSADFIIWIFFVLDLVVEFRNTESFGRFLIRCWPDIIAVLPFILFARVLKFAKILRIMEVFERSATVSRMRKLMHFRGLDKRNVRRKIRRSIDERIYR